MPRFFAVSNSLDKCHTFFLLLFSVFCWRMMEKMEKKGEKWWNNRELLQRQRCLFNPRFLKRSGGSIQSCKLEITSNFDFRPKNGFQYVSIYGWRIVIASSTVLVVSLVFNYVKFGKITNIVYYIIYTSNVSTIYYMIWILHCWNQGRASGTWQFFHFILVWAHVNPTWNITLSVRHKFLHKGFCPSPLKNVKFSMVFICFHNIATVYT